MKYLKKYKLFENNNLEELEEEVKNLSEGSLSFLFDKGFDAYISDTEDSVFVELSKWETIDEHTVERLDFNWDEIKDDFSPFLEILNEKYFITEIVFYEDVEDEMYRDDESTLEDILDPDFDRDPLQSIQVFLKNK